MIRYEFIRSDLYAVFTLNSLFSVSKRIGKIKKTNLGFHFFPKGIKIPSEPFATLDECKEYIERDYL